MTRTSSRELALAAAAASLYVIAAWRVAPGFYDGFTPTSPYPFVCPPATEGAHSSPASGHGVIGLSNGASEAASVYTGDGVVVIGFVPGSFDMAGKSSVIVNIAPVSSCPEPTGLRFVTNTYDITADASLTKSASLVMQYSDLEPFPSYIYRAQSPDGPWTNIGSSQQARLYTINAKTDQLGYYAAGFPANATSPGGSQVLPIVVAALVAAVLLASLPLAALRRRRR